MEKRKLNITWALDSWKNFEILQQPKWPDSKKYKNVLAQINSLPSLILSHEVNELKHRLKKVQHGKAFLLQGGDCAETFKEFSEINVKNKLKILFQMSTIIGYGSSLDVIKIGRIAGQYAKPRTSNLETKNGITLPVYRGDSINDLAFNFESRIPDSTRLLKAYNQSVATLNLIQTLIKNEFNDLEYFSLLQSSVFNESGIYNRFEKTINRIDKSFKFINALGEEIELFKKDRFNEFYVSHESLILDYEAALTKKTKNNTCYNSSAHMVWLGDRTRHINSAHVEYLSGIINPIGIKCGAKLDIKDLELIIKKLNPNNESGKIILICRFGEQYIEKDLPKLIKMVTKNNFNVIWSCDPMHGNTYNSKNHYKTRSFKTIINELKLFFNIHYHSSTYPGAVHFEFTPNNVTECVGGIRNIKESDLHINYETACDPRLNHEQSLELAFVITDLINATK